MAPLLAFTLGGCDPGWSYRPRSAAAAAQSRAGTAVSVLDGVDATASASLFSMGLDVEVNVVNRGPDPLHVKRQSLHVLDAHGDELPSRSSACRDADCQPVRLNVDQAYELHGSFRVEPLSGPFGLIANRDLKVVTIVVDGLTRAGHTVPLRFELEWTQ